VLDATNAPRATRQLLSKSYVARRRAALRMASSDAPSSKCCSTPHLWVSGDVDATARDRKPVDGLIGRGPNKCSPQELTGAKNPSTRTAITSAPRRQAISAIITPTAMAFHVSFTLEVP
jgi:hypothetical protein